ncbi:MAG: hypothetical protein Q8M98_00555 [Candidatus Cloacimonadaceae bacterium]|nr:hypothetical protein [Candidatus Cloacimonadaceae bacterium]
MAQLLRNIQYSSRGVDIGYGIGKAEDRVAMLAILDLIETAEYAIPKGAQKDWKDPTDPRLWTATTLIGRYYLGDDKTPVNIVIDLIGTIDSYIVDSCRLVSHEEYIKYQNKYDLWIKTLTEYYDFFEN